MEVVRILKALDLKPRRTIRIGLWSGEEQGLLGSRLTSRSTSASAATGLERGRAAAAVVEEKVSAGGDPLAKVTAKPDYDKFSGYFNLDNGTGKIRGVYLQGNEAARPLPPWLTPFQEIGAATINSRNTGGTDHQSFDGIGLPGFQFIQDDVEYDTRTHHSNQDLYDRIQADDMKQAAVIMAAFVYNTANRDEKLLVSVAIAAVVGVPTLRLSGHYFSMATIAVAELIRLIVTNTDYLGAAVGLSGPTVPRNIFDLSFISALPYYYLFLTVLGITLGITWWMANSRMGFYLRAIRDCERAARSLGAPASRIKLAAFMLSAGLTSVAGALYAMMFGFVDPEPGRHPDFRENSDHGGARRRRPFVRTAGRRGHPGAAGGNLQQPSGRPGRRADICAVRRHHRPDRALSAGWPAHPDPAAVEKAQAKSGAGGRGGSQPCSLRPAS